MDNFSIAVVTGDIVMCLAFIALMVFDKGSKPVPAEPMKSTGKRSA
jgi:hypothetical protein